MSTQINPDNGRLVINSDLSNLNLNTINDAGSTPELEVSLHVKGPGIYVDRDTIIDGTLVVRGDVISLGDGSTNLTLNSDVASNIIPSVTDNFSLGNSTNYWGKLYANTVNIAQSSTTDFSSNNTVIEIDATTTASQTLADGENGDVKIVVATQSPAATVVVAPTNANGFSTISFTDAGDSATMLFVNGAWNIVSNFRASVS